MRLPCLKNARRIFAIVSTTSIPTSASKNHGSQCGPSVPGSRLEADHPEKGVLFACRFTLSTLGMGLSARFRTPPLCTLQYELIDHFLLASAQSGRLRRGFGPFQQPDLRRHLEGRERRLLVALQSTLDLLQHDPLELADRPLSSAFAQNYRGGEGALDDGL